VLESRPLHLLLVQDEYSQKYRNVAIVLVIAGVVLLFVVTGVIIVSRS